MKTITHRFVDYIPEVDNMEEGVLYVCMEFGSVAHKCICGCGQEVITPLSPTDWKIIYNCEQISLYPSIGNWSFDCRSHYWISKSQIHWAEPWSEDQVRANRAADFQAKEDYFTSDDSTEGKERRVGFFQRLKNFIFG